MPRESIITIMRSTTNDTPTGMTFGELAYSDVNGKLFVGKNDGSSLWVGAGVTDGTLTTNSQYLIPTQSAVKTYVDGVVGGGSVVNTLNATGGAVTITGDGGAITNVQSGKANTIVARLATTGVTGVASFNSSFFTVSSGAVSLASAYQATGDTVAAVGSASVSRSGNVATIDNRIATTGVTGVASFSSTNFDVAAGAVSIKNGGVPNAALVNSTISGVALGSNLNALTIGTGLGGVSYNGQTATTITNTGVLSFNAQTGAVTLTGDGGAVSGVGNNTIAARLATSSLTGVASFPTADFTVASGAVSLASNVARTTSVVGSINGLTGAVTLTGDGGSQLVVGNNIITNRIATTSATGVASFNSSFFTVSSGAVSLASAYQVTGDTVAAVGSATVSRSGNVATIDNRLATSSLTGVASFPTTDFTVASGAVSLAATVARTNANNNFSVSQTFQQDVTVSGNLTVSGTVVTASVDNFVVEDPLIFLGTGNASDAVDLGFVAQYTSSGRRFTGLFRDATDGKYRLFTGLTGTAEPTTTVNDAGAGYTVATLVARIDGGTFP